MMDRRFSGRTDLSGSREASAYKSIIVEFLHSSTSRKARTTVLVQGLWLHLTVHHDRKDQVSHSLNDININTSSLLPLSLRAAAVPLPRMMTTASIFSSGKSSFTWDQPKLWSTERWRREIIQILPSLKAG